MLNVEILYKDIINDEEIKDFADSYKNNINAVIEHCSEVEDGFKTLSDFDVELDDANELNNLIESLDL